MIQSTNLNYSTSTQPARTVEADYDNDGKFDEKDKFDKNGEIIKQSKLQSLPSMILNFFKNLFS